MEGVVGQRPRRANLDLVAKPCVDLSLLGKNSLQGVTMQVRAPQDQAGPWRGPQLSGSLDNGAMEQLTEVKEEQAGVHLTGLYCELSSWWWI